MLLLFIILWKNLVLIKQHFVTTIVEIVLPLLFVGVLIFCNTLNQEGDTISEETTYASEELIRECSNQYAEKTFNIFYCPNTGFGEEMNVKLQETISAWGLTYTTLKGAKNEEQLEAFFTNLDPTKRENSLGLIFEDTNDEKPKDFKYTMKVPPANIQLHCFQVMVDFAYMNLVDPTDASGLTPYTPHQNPDLKPFTYLLEHLPSPKMIEPNGFEKIFYYLIVGFLGVAYSIIVTLIANPILDNKCSGVTELMKIMGVKRWMGWVSWLLKVLMIQALVVAVIIILLTVHVAKPGPVLTDTDPLILYIFFLLYVLALTSFMFAITALFFSALWGGLTVLLLCLISLITIMSVTVNSTTVQWALVFLPNGALFFGFKFISLRLNQGRTVTWANIHSGLGKGVNLGVNMLGIIIVLILEIVLYCLLAYYLEAVRKGPYGIPEPWYYPINKLMQLRKNKVDVDRTESQAPGKSQPNYEKPSKNDQPGISIQNLRKVYRAKNTVAVDGVNIDFYKGQITVLLGHNGAGKTTTMDIIAGMGHPTSGTVMVNGFNIHTDLEKARKGLGLCMQKNIMHNNLTVMENLTLVGLIKGKSWSAIRAEANEMLKLMNMENKKNSSPKSLSGGQKRKLCLCTALISGSQVVILDEPTSGLDPEARRMVWDVLLEMRGQRTILITTHYMEEADALGDKVAIMDHGKVVCYGTSLYLKNKYGGGFKITLIIQPNRDVNKITKVVESLVSGSELKSHVGAQLNYLLPTTNKSQFADLFDSLQKKKTELGILNMGVSAATLDDVFLAVGKQGEEQKKEVRRSRSLSERSLRDRITGLKLIWQQFAALLFKKLLYMSRKWMMCIIMVLLPILACIGSFLLNMSHNSTGESSYLSLSSALLDDPQIFYSAASDSVSTDIGGQYKAVVKSQGARVQDLSDQNDFLKAMLKKADENTWDFTTNTISAGQINVPKGGDKRVVIAFYKAGYDKQIPILLMNNAILRYRVNSNEYSIKVRTEQLQDQTKQTNETLRTMFVFFYLTMSMFMGMFMWLPHTERVSAAKQIQMMTGAGVTIYWLTIFLLDFLLYMITLTLLLITFVACDVQRFYSGAAEIGAVMLILLCYGLAQFPIVYMFSHVSASVTKSFFFYTLIHALFFLWTFMDEYIAMMSMKTKLAMENIPVPQYVLGLCFPKFFKVAFKNNQCNSFSEEDLKPVCVDGSDHPCCNRHGKIPYIGGATDDGLHMNLCRQLICMAIYWVLFIIIESGVIGLLFSCVPMGSKQTQEDDDVKNERERVKQGGNDAEGQDILVSNDLAKQYCCSGSYAVKGVTLGVLPGECFGLLGTNGAGKTTTFKMLTGGVIPTRGTARINQFWLKRNKGEYMQQIGYCPQEDPILEVLTGREMLVLFAQLRGIPRNKTHQYVDMMVQRVGLSEYERKRCGTYSGGNKRKLSAAMALIGDPPVVFLDEPTAGIDPVARRAMWGIMASLRKGHNCIVLTTHSMEECEALCSRLSIQVKGELKCIGTIPHLKDKFGKGFTVTIKLKDTKDGTADVDNLKKSFEEKFSPCEVKDEHSVLLQYHVTNPSLTWKFLFEKMESLKDSMPCIDDYSVSETSLEEIFLSFAKKDKKVKK